VAASMDPISIGAPAKVNFCLKIAGRRPDGYHDLVTLMHKVELRDLLHLRRCRAPGVRLTCPDSDLPLDAGNLAFRAARAFLDRLGGPAVGIEIVLEKRIPVAAGLGGGSSDAAAVLIGLDRLLDTGLSSDILFDLARPLGADVPFFVVPDQAAWATSIGDRLTPVAPLEEGWIVLANPGFPVSTRWVYENFALTRSGNPYILARGREMAERAGSGGALRRDAWQVKDVASLGNDLESVTIARFPEIGAIKRTMMAGGAVCALMSGSGPTVFGFFTHQDGAVRCVDALTRQYGHNVFLVRPCRAV